MLPAGYLPHILAELTVLDWVAAILLLSTWAISGHLIEKPPAWRPSVSALMRDHRREWMIQFLTREPRLFDANILATLRDSTAFFASSCMIAIGGCVALIGNVERLHSLAGQFEIGQTSAAIWDIKIILAMLIIVRGFLGFVWANRLFGYCAVMMATVPNDPEEPHSKSRSLAAAELNIIAAKHFNAGLRAIYFALGALGWFLGPWTFIIATLAVNWMVLRREFGSHSRRAMMAADCRSLPR